MKLPKEVENKIIKMIGKEKEITDVEKLRKDNLFVLESCDTAGVFVYIDWDKKEVYSVDTSYRFCALLVSSSDYKMEVTNYD